MLILTVLRCPDAVPPETKRVSGGEFKIGRGLDNDWVMPDPDRMLSKRHCVIAFRSGGWALADTSTNGTFLNRDAEPLGNGQIRSLADGDRIRFGAYEIEARIEAEAFAPPARAGSGFGGGSPFNDPFGDDVFAPKAAAHEGFTASAFGNDPLFGGPAPQQSVTMPTRYDAMSPPAEEDFFAQPTLPDHSPAHGDAFRPPPVAPKLIPDDDWDLGFPAPAGRPAPAAPPNYAPAAPASYAPPPAPAAFAPPGASPFDVPAAPAAAFAPPAAPAFTPPAAPAFTPPAAPAFTPAAPPAFTAPTAGFAAQPAPGEFPATTAAPAGMAPAPPAAFAPFPEATPSPFDQPAAAGFVPAPEPAKPPAAALSPFAEPMDFPPAQAAAPRPAAAAALPAAPLSAAPLPAAALSAAAAQAAPLQVALVAGPADALLTAYLEGAGMADAKPADPAGAMRALGAALRATVAGIRQALIARSSIKGEFRIEQTMIRARGNNPLKFSADDDDALGALLGVGRRTDVKPDAAIADALRDMRLHELATMAAMQGAVRALLAQLDPAKLRAEADAAGGMSVLPAQKKARAFDAYEKLHDTTTRALADDFDSVFGKSFARAYETALREATAREPQ